MIDKELEIKEKFFSRHHCGWCSSQEGLELDTVNPLTWPDPKMWGWPEHKIESYIYEDCQWLCGECFRRKKSMWKQFRVANEFWYQAMSQFAW